MKKLKLNLDELKVESFETISSKSKKGTFIGAAVLTKPVWECNPSGNPTSCGLNTCDESCQVGTCYVTCDPTCGNSCGGTCDLTCDLTECGQHTCAYSCNGVTTCGTNCL